MAPGTGGNAGQSTLGWLSLGKHIPKFILVNIQFILVGYSLSIFINIHQLQNNIPKLGQWMNIDEEYPSLY